MRLPTVLPWLVLGLLFAGCATPVCSGPCGDPPVSGVLGDVAVPEGGQLVDLAQGKAVSFGSVELPFRSNITLPEGATMVRLVADPGADKSVAVGMSSEQTGRRRCNNPTVTSFSQPLVGQKTCSYIAAIDPPGSTWRLAVTGTGSADVRVEFLTTPLDGFAAGLDLSQLSMPVHDLKPTETLFVPSHDGAKLRVEVTLPEGPGPWPAIVESSPYHDDGVRASPASWTYFVQDWAKRGYAVVVADVRGFGDSGGCVEVWGPNEQKDQAFLVEWTAQQGWSDGNVGFYGQSYVGTTPVEAAVLAPEHLKAIVTVAPVIKNYNDWHFGGVPNGENLLSPVGYAYATDAQTGPLFNAALALALGGQLPGVPDPSAVPEPRGTPEQAATTATNGPCDPADLARPNDPRAVYDQYYIERDFAAVAGNVKAAVLYTHGFEDANVKAQMIPDWFNALTAPKLGLFGHWLHQHPPRMDQEVLFLGWMDQYVKGKPVGFERLPAADVIVDAGQHRTADAWPSPGSTDVRLALDFQDMALAATAPSGSASITLDAVGLPSLPMDGPTSITVSGTLEEDLLLSGNAAVQVVGAIDGTNGYLAAYLYEENETDSSLVTWGWFNVAHRNGHSEYVPAVPGEAVTFAIPMRPTEEVLRAGNTLRLELTGVSALESLDGGGAFARGFTFQGGDGATTLILPTLPMASLQPIPLTATP